MGDGVHKHKVSARPTIADIAGHIVREVEVPIPADCYGGFALGKPFRVAGNGGLVHVVVIVLSGFIIQAREEVRQG